MNKVILSGRMVRDPELRYTQDGKAVANFTLAVSRIKKDEADYIKVSVWGNSAENVSKYCGKGSLVEVDGSIRTGSYEKDGQKHFTTDVVASFINFLETKKKEEAQSDDPFSKIIDDEDVPF